MKGFILMLICIASIIVQTITKDYPIVVCILYFYVIINCVWSLFEKDNKEHKYRVHITCPAGHLDYEDFGTLVSAVIKFLKMQDKTTWHAVHIEKIIKM